LSLFILTLGMLILKSFPMAWLYFLNMLSVLVHMYNPSTQEAETGVLWVIGQPDLLHSETWSQNPFFFLYCGLNLGPLYPLSHDPSPFGFFSLFFIYGLRLPAWPSLKSWSSYIYLLSSWDCRCAPPHLACFEVVLIIFAQVSLKSQSCCLQIQCSWDYRDTAPCLAMCF
jgi:hypothetical protein